jgi:AhpD family alkylhydroperoxidase
MLGNQYFKKRSYTFRTFVRDFSKVIKRSSSFKKMAKSGRISRQFQERIMLAVTAVNNCRYCEWGHTKMALNEGCNEEEINQIMTHDFDSCNPDEVVALAYAQHYAETRDNPTGEYWDKLVDFYGKEKAEEIQLVIETITMGNLLGNTLDAFESRFKGKPPEKGSWFFELFLYTFAFPFVLFFNRKHKKWKEVSNPHPD